MRRTVGWSSAVLLAVLSAAWFPGVGACDEPAAAPWKTDVNAAWQQAKASGRPLLLVATTTNCPSCEQLKRTTLADKKVLAAIDRAFIAAYVNGLDHPALVRKLHIEAFPTTVIIGPDGRVRDIDPRFPRAAAVSGPHRLLRTARVASNPSVTPRRRIERGPETHVADL